MKSGSLICWLHVDSIPYPQTTKSSFFIKKNKYIDPKSEKWK
jgi:hypothetical protein